MAMLMLLTRRPAIPDQPLAKAPGLRAWLRAGWAVLFSHPEDFACYDIETDRWLAVIRDAFKSSGVRPLTLASTAEFVDRSWVSQVSEDTRTVLLEDPLRQHFGAVDLQACALREEIGLPGRRFVMILDTQLRSRRTFSYDTRANLPSPLEILAWAEALRKRQHHRPVPSRACTPLMRSRAHQLLRRAG